MELRKTSVDIVPKSICGQPNSNGDIVTEKMICAWIYAWRSRWMSGYLRT